MRAVQSMASSWRRPAWLLALLAVAAFALPALAFPPPRRGPSKAPKPPAPSKPAPPPSNATNGYGKIMKYTPAGENSKNENKIGELQFKPQGRKSIKLQIIKDPEPEVVVADANDYKVDLDGLGELLSKGLYCDASWNAADPTEAMKPTATKNLSKLTLTTFEVVGKIEKIQNDSVELKARPKGDRAWPDMDDKTEPSSKSPGAKTTKPKTIPVKMLKLKMIDGMTRFADSGNQALTIDDFQEGLSVEAKIVYGGKDGIMVVLSNPNSKSGGERKAEEKPPPKKRGVAPPPH